MGRVTVTLNNRSYRLNCRDGEENRIALLADHIRKKVDTVIDEFGQVGEERLLVMAALMVTDELFDMRDRSATDGDDEMPLAASDAELGAVETLEPKFPIGQAVKTSAVETAAANLSIEPSSTGDAGRDPQVSLTRSSRFAKRALSSRKPAPTV